MEYLWSDKMIGLDVSDREIQERKDNGKMQLFYTSKNTDCLPAAEPTRSAASAHMASSKTFLISIGAFHLNSFVLLLLHLFVFRVSCLSELGETKALLAPLL
jgi:hypothetical protein